MAIAAVADTVTVTLSVEIFILSICNLAVCKHTPKTERWLSYYIVTCCLFDLLSWLLAHVKNSNIIELPFFDMAELFFFMQYFKNRLTAKSIYFLLITGVLVCGYDILATCLVQRSDFYNIGRMYNALTIILSTFYVLFRTEKATPSTKLNYIIILYFSITFIHFLFLNFLMNVPLDIKYIFWILYALACGLFYLIITLYIWNYGRTPKY